MRFYRSAHSDPPTEADFRSYAELGHRVPGGAPCESALMKYGVSVWDNFADAEWQALSSLAQGEYVVAIEIVGKPIVTFRQSGKNRAHYDLHGGTPASRLAFVIDGSAVKVK